MKLQNTIIISLAIITAGYMVSESLKPAQAIGGADYSMAIDQEGDWVWVLNNSSGDVKLCHLEKGRDSVCGAWSE